ncbi:MAG: helix-turn-helix domain-containing protein [Firmicutes bacterium]|nr:helix-turn-helix domain-containing protein [Bacillota bacterium]
MGKSKLQNYGLFARILFSYMTIIVVPISVCFFIMNNIINTLEYERIETNLLSLEHSSVQFEERLNEMNNIAIAISLIPRIKTVLHGSKTSYDIWQAQKDLFSFSNNTFINSLYVVCQNGVVIAPDNAYDGSIEQYNVFTYNDMDFQSLTAHLFEEDFIKRIYPSGEISYNGDKKNMIMYVQKIPIDFNKDKLGCIIMLVDAEKIANIMDKKNSYVEIIDGDGKSIIKGGAAVETTKALGKERGYYTQNNNLVLYTTSESTGYKYLAANSENSIIHQIKTIRTIIIIVIFLWLVLGSVISIYFSKKHSFPILEITSMLKRAKQGKNEPLKQEDYSYIKDSIVNILESNVGLSKKVDTQKLFVQTEFLYKLMKTGFKNKEEMDEAGKLAEIELSESAFVVIGVMLGEENADEQKSMVFAMLEGYSNTFPIEIKSNILAVLVVLDKVELMRAEVEKIINQISDWIVFAGVGSIKHDLMEVVKSCNEALDLLEIASIENANTIMWSEDATKRVWSYFYPLEIESKLVRLVKEGDEEETNKLLNTIFVKNYVDSQLSYDMMKYLIMELKGTIIKIIDSLLSMDYNFCDNIKIFIDKLNVKQNPIDDFQTIKDICSIVCKRVLKNKKENNEFADLIIEYIDDNISKPDMYVASIADKFNVNIDYANNLFRKETGFSIATYINRKRMIKAADELNKKDLSTERIAELCGYNSPRAFRRAFKRFHSLTPQEYRNLSREKK